MTKPEQKLAELEALEKAATKGPWRLEAKDGNGNSFIVKDIPGGWLCIEDSMKNNQLIAAARNEMKWMIEAIRKMKEALEFYADGYHYQVKNTKTGERSENLVKDDGDGLVLSEDDDLEIENGERARKALAELEGDEK